MGCCVKPPCGERHHNAKLTDEQVREIRRQYAECEKGYRMLADIFECSVATVRDIIKGKTRKSA
jgi:DNA invertase Pin-like site-specific DNA recombinase